jgi:hypothetical protein
MNRKSTWEIQGPARTKIVLECEVDDTSSTFLTISFYDEESGGLLQEVPLSFVQLLDLQTAMNELLKFMDVKQGE